MLKASTSHPASGSIRGRLCLKRAFSTLRLGDKDEAGAETVKGGSGGWEPSHAINTVQGDSARAKFWRPEYDDMEARVLHDNIVCTWRDGLPRVMDCAANMATPRGGKRDDAQAKCRAGAVDGRQVW